MPKKKSQKRSLELISMAELARRKRVARSTATRACKRRLRAAMAGELVDASHPEVRKWLAEADRAPTQPAPIKAAASAGPTADDFTALTLRKRRAEVAALERDLERQDGRLIAAEYVRQRVFGPIGELFHRLLTDFVATSASSALAAVASGASAIEVQTLLRDRLAPELERCKRSMASGMRHCKAGDNPPELQDEPAVDDTADRAHAARSSFAQALAADLRGNATPKVVAAVVKAFGRAAAGRFDDVVAMLPNVEPEAARHVAAMLDGHVTKLLSRMATDENQDPSS